MFDITNVDPEYQKEKIVPLLWWILFPEVYFCVETFWKL